MGLIALLAALLIEQFRPRAVNDRLHRAAMALADAVLRRFGGTAGWFLLVAAAVLLVWLLDVRLRREYPGTVFLAHVAILYYTIGFRRLGHAFAQIRSALVAEEPLLARGEFEGWLAGVDATDDALPPGHVGADADRAADRFGDDMDDRDTLEADRDPPVSEPELCRAASAAALLAMHRHLFAPLFWYLLLPGVAGPVLYRLCAFLERHWSVARTAVDRQDAMPAADAMPEASATSSGHREAVRVREGLCAAWRTLRNDGPMAAVRTIRSVEPGLVARRSFYWLDWPAVRFTAAGFAIMGNFEDALYCWRAAIAAGTDDARALLLASGSGALGVRLADDALEARWSAGEQGVDCAVASPEVRTLPAAVSLVWRAAALWVGLLALLTIAGWLGR